MAVRSSFQILVIDQLSRIMPSVRARSMFGGVGIYSGDLFFALIADDTLYFKTDASTRPEFETRGMEPFRPFGDSGGTMKYYQVPEDLLEDPEALRPWAEKAVDVARRNKGKRPSRRARSVGVSFEEASKIARTLLGVGESTSYGTPALKVEGRLFARLKEDGETLVLRMDFVNRDLLLRAEPDLFFLTDHYVGYPWILLRLTRVTRKRLTELLEDAWRLAAPRRLSRSPQSRENRQPNTPTRTRRNSKS